MDHLEPAISFEIPSNFNFDTSFSSNSNRTQTINLLRKLNEKFGRGLSTSEVNLIRNQVILNGSNTNLDNENWLKQVEYDKFMNEIWIGIVLTLIVISMVFCLCSCFLYHQFRLWKRNYHQNIQQNLDIESIKLNFDEDDQLPDYTLVSGLPSYDAAMELLQQNSSTQNNNNCLLVYPSVFKIFSNNEKENCNSINTTIENEKSFELSSIRNSSGNSSKDLKPEDTLEEAPSYEDALLETNPRLVLVK